MIKLLRENVILLMLIAVYVLVRSLYWDCPPIWDGRVCYSSLLKAKADPFDILNYSDPDGHVAQGFMLLMGLPYLFLGKDFYLFNIWLTLFGIISVLAFHQLLTFFTQVRLRKFEIVLITGLFAFHPSVLASMIHFCFDIGIISFFLMLWLCLLRGHTIAAAVCAVLLLFTKETSFLLLPLPFFFCCLLQPTELRLKWIRRHIWIPWIAYSILVGFLAYKSMFREVPALWVNYHASSPLATILNYFDDLPKLFNYLGMIFVLNFNWVLSLLWLGLGILLFHPKYKNLEASWANTAFLLFVLFELVALVLTLVRPFSNVRYVALLLPLMLLGVAQLLSGVIPSLVVRTTLVACLLALFAWEDIRTVDPISRKYFSTFAFGRHRILKMTERTAEPAGFGRDQLVYNLEFMKLPRLLNRVMGDVRPTSNTVFVACDREAFWSFFVNVDNSTYKATYQQENVVTPQFKSVMELLAVPPLPNEVLFIAFPNWSNDEAIATLSQQYSNRITQVYDIDGYQLETTHFRR